MGDSRGLSVPAKMQHLVTTLGRARMLTATAAAALTRPLGLHGAFYVVAGHRARALDGLRPPFEHLLLPSLSVREATSVAQGLAAEVGHPVAVIDLNDRGGSIRAVSDGDFTRRELRRALADNPLGQRDQRTPFGLIRRLSPVPRQVSAPAPDASLASPAGTG